MPHLDVTGATLYYESDGPASKPAVLLIHAGIANLRMWDPLVAALADDHFVVRFDTRGFGETAAEDVEFSDRADARAILGHLGIEQATIVGCSRGGGIAIDLALESPNRVRGLVLIGAGPGGLPEPDPTPQEDALLDRLDEAFAQKDWSALNELEVRLWAIGPTRDQRVLDQEFVETAYALNRANLRHAEERPHPLPLDPPAYDRLVDIAVPTLVAVGDHDLTEVLAASEYLLTNIRTADGARFPDAAHLPSVERPAEFNRVLVEWLEGNTL